MAGVVGGGGVGGGKDGNRRSGRSAGVLNGTVLFVVVAILAAVALVAKAPAPPSIAELTPKAVQQIKNAPDNLSSQFGEGGDGACLDVTNCPSGSTTTTSTTAPADNNQGDMRL